MQTAQLLANILNAVAVDKDGFRNPDTWEFLVSQAVEAAAHIGPREPAWVSGSTDPELQLTYEDRSILIIRNPRQGSFPGYAY